MSIPNGFRYVELGEVLKESDLYGWEEYDGPHKTIAAGEINPNKEFYMRKIDQPQVQQLVQHTAESVTGAVTVYVDNLQEYEQLEGLVNRWEEDRAKKSNQVKGGDLAICIESYGFLADEHSQAHNKGEITVVMLKGAITVLGHQSKWRKIEGMDRAMLLAQFPELREQYEAYNGLKPGNDAVRS